MKQTITNHIIRNKKEYAIVLVLLAALALVFPIHADTYQGELDKNYVEKNVTKPQKKKLTYFQKLKEKSRLKKLDEKVKKLGVEANYHRQYKSIRDYERVKISAGTQYVIYDDISKALTDAKYRDPNNKKIHVYNGKARIETAIIMKSRYFRTNSQYDCTKWDSEAIKNFKKGEREEDHYYWFVEIDGKLWQLTLEQRVLLDE